MTTTVETNIQALEEDIHDLLQEEPEATLDHLIEDVHPADIADVLERLQLEDGWQVFMSLDVERGSDVLHELGRERTRQLFREMSSENIARYLDVMPTDEVADILDRDIADRQTDLLEAMRPEKARHVRKLIGYPDDSAGRLMTDKFPRIGPNVTVQDALDYLREINPDVETVNDIYVTDADEKLLGVVSLREIVTARDSQTRLEDIMTTDLVTVPPDTDQEDAARLVARYDFLALPVVSTNGRILGIITVDDVINVLTRENTEDAMRSAGIEDSGIMDQPYFTVPIWRFVRARIGWLLILFVGQTLTGTVLRGFEVELETVVALSFFIPLLIGTGGNTGAQIVTTVIRGVALRNIHMRDLPKVVVRELASGLLLGAILGVAGVFFALFWGQVNLEFAAVVGLTIMAICTWSNVVGAVIPLFAKRVGIDPAVVSAPLITTLVDASGLLIYMLIAKAILDVI